MKQKRTRNKKLTDLEIEFLQHSNYIEREYGEVALKDAIKAWEFAVEFRETLTVAHILHIHKLLLGRLRPDIAGRFRDCAVWISGRYCPIELPFALEQKVDSWIHLCFKRQPADVSSQESHVRFEYLHPFEDGNGRVGRILYNIQRLNNGEPLHIIHEGAEQMEYYKWFQE